MHEFTIGGVVRQTIETIKAQFGPLLIWSILLIGLPNVAGSALSLQLARAGVQRGAFIPLLFTALGPLLLLMVTTHRIVEARNGRTPTIGESLSRALRLFLPTLAIYVIKYIVLALSAILLIFPSLMLSCRWIVAIPIEVVEKPGIFASFSRSAELTSGVRWRVLGILLISMLLVGMISVISLLVVRLTGVPALTSWVSIIVNAVATSLLTPISYVGEACLYIALRQMKEGALSQDLVSVFD